MRELRNLIERLVILATGELIEPHQLPSQFTARSDTPALVATPGRLRPLADVEHDYIVSVLQHVNGNKSEAAKVLGITRQTLRKKLAEGASEQ